jgi:hypothetical protein
MVENPYWPNLKSGVRVCSGGWGYPPDPQKEFQVGEPSVAELRLYSALGDTDKTALVPRHETRWFGGLGFSF